MRVRTIDGVEIQLDDAKDDGEPELIALHSDVVFAATRGTMMARAATIADRLTVIQFDKLFGRSRGRGGGRYCLAQRLRSIGRVVRDQLVRSKLMDARAGWRELVYVAKFRDPESQLAAFARHTIMKSLSKK